MKVLRNKKGFTMIELMIVAIIVAILAVVLIPLMSANKYRAYATEAEATLGTIRTAMRVALAENEGLGYPLYTAPTAITLCSGTTQAAGVANISFSAPDLLGTYFSAPNYTIGSTATTYTITCTWTTAQGATAAPQNSKVIGLTGFTTTLNQDGTFVRTGY
jgi:prepilin-type N-terminal cleavage/methylation domain-containing protein